SSFVTLDGDCAAATKLGGGAGTDNWVKLSAVALSATQAQPLDLVMDGCSAVTTVLLPPTGHYSIRGIGRNAGFYSRPGASSNTLTNGYSADYPPPMPPTLGSNVLLRDLTINGNRATYPHGN